MKLEQCTGVYGIYINEEIVYIGSTTDSFARRFSKHKSRMKEPPEKHPTQIELYDTLKAAKASGYSVVFRPLIVVEELKYRSLVPIEKRDVESMEFALIDLYKPRLNKCGVTLPFKYNY